ncbi:hypothetical protein [Halalkalicoccus subterraneus]|nr:hypothetical protein [Halalkalicoccus subterraneus]
MQADELRARLRRGLPVAGPGGAGRTDGIVIDVPTDQASSG